MEEKKMYYLGTGTEFVKAQCKEYKTIEGALKAATKDESLVVWDEDGNIVGSLTDNVPDDALKTNPDGNVNAYDAEGNPVGTVDAEKVAAVTGETPENDAEGQQAAGASGDNAEQGKNAENETGQPATENDENGANNASEDEEQEGDAPESGITNEKYGKFVVTVTCEGSLRLRRSASFTENNECGRATKGQTYMGKRIFMTDGLPMVETVDGLFLSAADEHVKIDKIG